MADLDTSRADVLRIAGTYGATNIRVVAAGDRVGELELVVDMDPTRSLFDLVDLGRELTELIGRPVEVLSAESLNPRLRAQLLADARAL